MIAYIRDLSRDIAESFGEGNRAQDFKGRFVVLAEELDRLDARDFLPSERFELLCRRRQIRSLAHDERIGNSTWTQLKECKRSDATSVNQNFVEKHLLPLCFVSEYPDNPHVILNDVDDTVIKLVGNSYGAIRLGRLVEAHIQSILIRLAGVIDAYGGPDSQAVSRSFTWMTNGDLQRIVERDYRELVHVLFPAGAWKSSVVLAGSILEAVLYDRLTRDPEWIQRAMDAKDAPGKKGGTKRDISLNVGDDEWRLASIIKVAAELDVIPKLREETVDRVLREYRNLIHPHKEYREQQGCTEAEAMMAVGALKGVCDYLEKHG